MKIPKYVKGDLVEFTGTSDHPCCKHIHKGLRAIVMYDTNTQGEIRYGLLVYGYGESAWYSEDDVELVEIRRIDLIGEFESHSDKEHKKRIDAADLASAIFVNKMLRMLAR